MASSTSSSGRPRFGFTLAELLVLIAAATLVAAMLAPMLAAMQGLGAEQISANNLRQIGTMHVMYAIDWNGRQWTVTPDDLSVRLNFGSYPSQYPPHIAPAVPLGEDCSGVEWSTRGGWAIQPMWYAGNCGLGNFRAWNTQPFNNYASGRVYDRMFWAPRDPGYKELEEFFNSSCEWFAGASFYFPTYCLSPAAQVAPEVYRGPQDGGSQRAISLPLGHQTPGLMQAAYPDLKTHMLEHYWLNPPPDPPFIPDTGGVPWYFNMSRRSQPMTLFFDGTVRKLPVREVLISNEYVTFGGADRLWADDPACFGTNGYYEQYQASMFIDDPTEREGGGQGGLGGGGLGETGEGGGSSFEFERMNRGTSYHMFTRDGIRGRDTIFTH